MNGRCLASSVAFAGVLWCGAANAVPQTFVHSEGSDLNVAANCTVAKPCRTFAAALTVTDSGGEIMALDTENFGPVVIRQSVSIIGNGQASIVPAFGAAVSIGNPGIDVVLRGLNIDGVGAGSVGITMRLGRSLTMENCVIANFLGHGLSVTTPASVRIVDSVLRRNANGARIQGGATADVVRSHFMGNAGAGLLVSADTAATTSAMVSDSVASGNLVGFDADSNSASGIGRMVITGSTAAHNTQAGFLSSASAGNAIMTVGSSTAARNGIGFAHFPGVAGISTLETLGNNAVRQNTTASVGLIATVAPM